MTRDTTRRSTGMPTTSTAVQPHHCRSSHWESTVSPHMLGHSLAQTHQCVPQLLIRIPGQSVHKSYYVDYGRVAIQQHPSSLLPDPSHFVLRQRVVAADHNAPGKCSLGMLEDFDWNSNLNNFDGASIPPHWYPPLGEYRLPPSPQSFTGTGEFGFPLNPLRRPYSYSRQIRAQTLC